MAEQTVRYDVVTTALIGGRVLDLAFDRGRTGEASKDALVELGRDAARRHMAAVDAVVAKMGEPWEASRSRANKRHRLVYGDGALRSVVTVETVRTVETAVLQ